MRFVDACSAGFVAFIFLGHAYGRQPFEPAGPTWLDIVIGGMWAVIFIGRLTGLGDRQN